MKIGIDVRHLAAGPTTGVGVVTNELIPALASAAPEDRFHVFYNGWHGPPPMLEEWRRSLKNITVHTSRIPNRFFDLAVQTIGMPKVKRRFDDADVHLSPHMLPVPKMRTPRVLVLHDLSFVRHPEYFHPRRRFWHARIAPAAQARNAQAIIVPSRSTARDVRVLWGIAEEKIHVVPWAPPSANPQSTTHNRQQGHGRTILFVGTVEKRKNVTGLIEAFALLKQAPDMEDVRLVVAGEHGWAAPATAGASLAPLGRGSIRIDKKTRDAIVFTGYVSEDEKAELLKGASVFAYPSFYEGSGLPVLEAMRAGIPCVVSQRTALPEVTGNAALLVDPKRPREIAEALRHVLRDSSLAVHLARRGKERAASFTWDKTAQQILDVLRSVAERGLTSAAGQR